MEPPTITTITPMESSSSTVEPFRLNAKQLFLTYSHCKIPKERILELLSEKLPTIVDYVVASEPHQDGSCHIHCYIKLARKVNIKDPHFFDLFDPLTGEWAKGNDPEEAYQGCRSPRLVWNYCRKEGNFISNMKQPPTCDVYSEALSLAAGGNLSSSIKLLRKRAPRDFLLNKERFVKTLVEEKPRYAQCRHNMQEYPAWKDEWWDRKNRTLILIGEPGVGKTELAKSLIPKAHYTKNVEGLKDFHPLAHEGIIFDDVTISDRDITEQVNILDLLNETTIRILYRTVTLPAGMPRIITCHIRDVMAIADFSDGAVRRRCNMVHVKKWDDMEPVDIDELLTKFAAQTQPMFVWNNQRRRGGGKWSGFANF